MEFCSSSLFCFPFLSLSCHTHTHWASLCWACLWHKTCWIIWFQLITGVSPEKGINELWPPWAPPVACLKCKTTAGSQPVSSVDGGWLCHKGTEMFSCKEKAICWSICNISTVSSLVSCLEQVFLFLLFFNFFSSIQLTCFKTCHWVASLTQMYILGRIYIIAI